MFRSWLLCGCRRAYFFTVYYMVIEHTLVGGHRSIIFAIYYNSIKHPAKPGFGA